MYSRDPSLRGEFTVNLTHESISVQNPVGIDLQMKWSLFEYWRENKDLIVLVYRTGAFFPISLSKLSEAEKVEIRAVLAGSVPHSESDYRFRARQNELTPRYRNTRMTTADARNVL
jgi:hypothetical protein